MMTDIRMKHPIPSDTIKNPSGFLQGSGFGGWFAFCRPEAKLLAMAKTKSPAIPISENTIRVDISQVIYHNQHVFGEKIKEVLGFPNKARSALK